MEVKVYNLILLMMANFSPYWEKRQSFFDSKMSEVEVMEENKIQRAEIILNKIFSSETVSPEDPSGYLNIEDKTLRVKVSTFVQFATTDNKNDLARYTNLCMNSRFPHT